MQIRRIWGFQETHETRTPKHSKSEEGRPLSCQALVRTAGGFFVLSTVHIGAYLFQMDIGALINDYKSQGLPMPTMEQLQAEVIAEARKCLETIMICEAKGHMWKETADPENGTSTLSCRRCGAEEHLRW